MQIADEILHVLKIADLNLVDQESSAEKLIGVAPPLMVTLEDQSDNL